MNNNFHVIICTSSTKNTPLKRKKPKNIFFLYRDEMMPFRPFGMPMCDYNRIIRDKWNMLPDEEKDRYRLVYEISRDVIEDVEQTSSQTKVVQNSCSPCTFCGISIENAKLCHACVEQLYQFDSMYSYYHCELCSSVSLNSRICIVCYEQLNSPQFDYSFFNNGEIDTAYYGSNYDTNSSSEGILGLADIDYENFIDFED